MNRLVWRVTPCLAMLAVAGMAFGQDPPSRVARIAYMTGAVSFEPATVDQWTGASLNYPMTTGDNLYTDPNGSRAVLRIGRNSIRLNAGTNFQFVNLSDQVVQFSINSGSVSVRVRNLYQGETWEVDTPNGAVTLSQAGEYRIDTDPNKNATMVTSRNGEADVTSNDQSFPVYARQTAYFSADGAPDIEDQNPNDAFDGFAYSRDRMEDVPPPQYVSPDLVGYEDLSANGSWSNDSEYGPVWRPRVDAGWAPYRNGHWAWVEPWGWSWVDDAPWGFAPFHYGRWAFVGDSWGWCPGPVNVRPVYAPALVAFIGGGGFGLSIGIGGGGGAIGWFPLGPRDPFIPSYQVSNTYIRNVNISNTRVTNINYTNINVTTINYTNRNVAGAVVAMPQAAFASAQPVQRSMVKVNAAQLQQAQVVGAAPVVPQRAAVLASAGGGRVAAPPANIASRPVVAKLAPPPPPVSFAAKQQVLAQHPGQPVAPAQLQTIRRQSPPVASAARPQVQKIDTAQVKPITPTVHPGSTAGGFSAPRGNPAPANAVQQPRPGQPVPGANQVRPGQPAPQAAPPMRQAAPTPPAVPPTRQPAPTPQAVPPTRQPVPAPRPVPLQEQMPRPQTAAPAPVRTPAPAAAPAPRPVPQEQAPRPQYTPPVRPQAAPPVPQREAPPAEPQRQAAPAPRETTPAPQRQAPPPQAQPQRQPAPPPARPAPEKAPPKEDDKDKKKE